MRHQMHRTRFAAAILLLAYLPACTSYQVIADPSTGLQASPKPIEEARITLRTGERFELNAPGVYGDSLRGIPHQGSAKIVAMGDVSKMEVRRPSTGKTVGLVLGIVVVGGLIAGGIALASMDTFSMDLSGACFGDYGMC